MKDPIIRKKIRHTWRLQYLKDVVLARILDDPTFSVLNSLIFFNQVDIINHIQSNASFLNELFTIFDPRNTDQQRKDDAVSFLHQCAAIAKNLQAPARAALFANFISHGLFAVIAFAVKHPKPAMRTTGIDILVALLDHDPIMMRSYMLKAVNERRTPLTDTLIDLLHTEPDLGVKNQLSDAIKVLLDPQIPLQDPMNRAGADFLARLRPSNPLPDAFVQNHFDESSKRLFAPLKELEGRTALNDFTFQDVSLYTHLVDILTFFVRQHLFRCRNFIHAESLTPRVAQLLTVPQKHLKLTALKFFRTLISLQDTFYIAQLTHNNTFGLILDIVCETMPRDNLLNSACLEMFEYIKRENIKAIITHVVERYRDKLKAITYVDTFENLILRYDQLQGNRAEGDAMLLSQDESVPSERPVNGQRWQGVREMDAAEEEYFNASDDEEEVGGHSKFTERHTFADLVTLQWQQENRQHELAIAHVTNQAQSTVVKPLVDYPDDDDDIMDANAETAVKVDNPAEAPATPTSTTSAPTPPERLSEKRRREDEDEDELVRLAWGPKRRSSSNASSTGSMFVRGRKKSQSNEPTVIGKRASKESPGSTAPNEGSAPKKIAINLSPIALKTSIAVDSTKVTDKEASSENTNGDGGG
jgi:protein phosphatase-4 regulatory subunit 3